MTARDFIASLAPVDLDRQAKIFSYLADHVYESGFRRGYSLRDATDFRQLFHELAEAARLAQYLAEHSGVKR